MSSLKVGGLKGNIKLPRGRAIEVLSGVSFANIQTYFHFYSLCHNQVKEVVISKGYDMSLLFSISILSSPYSQYLQAQTRHPHIPDTNFLSIYSRFPIFVKKYGFHIKTVDIENCIIPVEFPYRKF